ncbi:membrane protein [Arthrobacter phage Lilmac1015]|uniref:Membrane protein n=1 Tax=Arthrobacter phage Lilmac1015 TaxID=2912653 RepID=A0AA49BQ37_9CAUD|nr:membrane protein [Arthrobacter phage Lilmac1015]
MIDLTNGRHEAADPSAISPKVLVSLAVGLALTALSAALAAITPETLADLGPYAVPVALGAAAAGQALAGYMKRDPARTGAPLPASETPETPESGPLG